MVFMALYLKITLKNQRFHCVISYWHASNSLLSAHLGPVLLNSFWSQSPSCCQAQILIPPSHPSPLPFSSPWFSIHLLWIWVFSFLAPRKEVKNTLLSISKPGFTLQSTTALSKIYNFILEELLCEPALDLLSK